MARARQRCTRKQRQRNDKRDVSQYIFDRSGTAKAGLQNPKRHHVGKDQSAAEFQLPLSHARLGADHLGKKK